MHYLPRVYSYVVYVTPLELDLNRSDRDSTHQDFDLIDLLLSTETTNVERKDKKIIRTY